MALAGGATAHAALVELTPDAPINDDPFSGLVFGGPFDGSVSAAAGSLFPGTRKAPWVAFVQDQRVFVRAFGRGRWSTRGQGPVADGAVGRPALAFAGIVPWTAWSAGGDVFVSSFDTGRDLFEPARAVNLRAASDPALAGDENGPLLAWRDGGDVFAARGPEFPLLGDRALRIDRTRAAGDPAVALAGGVPWVVWREQGPSAAGLADNSMLFAARFSGGVWTVVGQDLSASLDVCAGSALNEGLCSVQLNLAGEVGPPRVAAGTMIGAGPPVPWIVWSEQIDDDLNVIFAARLVGDHFEPANGGRALGNGTLPDIAFSGDVPYVSWLGPDAKVHVGHFRNPASFRSDQVSSSHTVSRPALTTTCCEDDALGTPFVAFGDGPLALRGGAYPAGTVVTADPIALTADGATVGGTITPGGAPAQTHTEFGPTTAYGSSTPAMDLFALEGLPIFFDERLSAPPGTTVHYRFVAENDLVRSVGADRTFTTPGGTPPPCADPCPPPEPTPCATPCPAPGPTPCATPCPTPEPAPCAVSSSTPCPTPVPTSCAVPGSTPCADPVATPAQVPTLAPPPRARRPHLTARAELAGTLLRVRLATDTRADVTVRATLTGTRSGHRAYALGTARTQITGPRTLTLKLPPRASRALHTLEAARIAIVAVAASAGGTATVRTVLRPPRGRR